MPHSTFSRVQRLLPPGAGGVGVAVRRRRRGPISGMYKKCYDGGYRLRSCAVLARLSAMTVHENTQNPVRMFSGISHLLHTFMN